MKNILLAFLFLAFCQTGIAQKYISTLKNNTELQYVCKLHGQTRTLSLVANTSKENLILKLDTRGVKSSIVILAEALKNGNALSFNQGEYAPVLNLKSNETFFMISQSAYQNLVQNNSFVYNNTTYDVDKNEDKNGVSIDGKLIDAFHVIAQIDQTEMWIVKNPEFPLICKITKNPLGINFTLVKVIDN
ncbi:hypothetical protein GKZ90_0018680 [Flavobacterium sp. MC2016-06]|jgi:hypothetical protein|uniref:hypothetical protein n=1 Tax=Flavobacterium sp. MC2016-06 TaxID=2676308 RepID=UPI0012BA9358|nr:hypothetical protein [Flavobacterium sp. MC2016-06]MBU3861569.1 hypothetical protein [Flavobacterium sp. MC2016-06]